MSLQAMKEAVQLLERARDIIEYNVPPCEAKLMWLRDLTEFDKGEKHEHSSKRR